VFPLAVTLPFVHGLMVRTVSGLDHELPDFLPPARAGRAPGFPSEQLPRP
jgi:hypothetical protein